eukprot:SAG11_NODE_1824_length_4204_cov_8.667235_1_plen_87_part_10
MKARNERKLATAKAAKQQAEPVDQHDGINEADRSKRKAKAGGKKEVDTALVPQKRHKHVDEAMAELSPTEAAARAAAAAAAAAVEGA